MIDIQIMKKSNGVISVDLGGTSSAITGLGKLVQLVTKCLLTTPGIDLFNPEWGAGLATTLPKVTGDGVQARAHALASLAVLKCEKDIKSNQSSGDQSPEEMLGSLVLRDLTFDTTNLGWIVDIGLRSLSGEVSEINLDL